jgi:carboxypeptidase PM20D1
VFSHFREILLPSLYPLTHAHLRREQVGDTGLLFHWKGRTPDRPSVLMSHYDVVPADAAGWKHPPFDGQIHEGQLWGRGTLDTKLTLCAALEAGESCLAAGFVPEHDLYLSFAGDEEVIGQTAPAIVDLLASRGIRPALVLDEGGAVLSGVFPGVPGRVAMIGVAEKGMMDLEMTAPGEGGHASVPPRHTAAGRIARAVVRAERRHMRHAYPRTVRDMLTALRPHAPFPMRIFLRLLLLSGPLGARLLGRLNPQLGAMPHTTFAFTRLSGSPQANVLPTEASAVVNVRIRQGDSTDRAIRHLRRAVRDPAVSFRILQGNEPSPETAIGSPAYGKVRDVVSRIWPDAVVLPYLMVACTDARHFCRISDNVLRFSAMEITSEQLASIHNTDERVSTRAVLRCAAFYKKLVLGL